MVVGRQQHERELALQLLLFLPTSFLTHKNSILSHETSLSNIRLHIFHSLI